jgi:hypothetical protein
MRPFFGLCLYGLTFGCSEKRSVATRWNRKTALPADQRLMRRCRQSEQIVPPQTVVAGTERGTDSENTHGGKRPRSAHGTSLASGFIISTMTSGAALDRSSSKKTPAYVGGSGIAVTLFA